MAAAPRGLKLAAGQLGGTGKDADKGKGRTQFENDRRKGNIGKDRPPVYKPPTDYRGGYQAKPSGRFAAFVGKLEKKAGK